MRSLLAEVDRPAVDAFLSAVDSVMNSNTLLLKVRTDTAPPAPRDPREALHAYLGSALFEETMRAADRLRGWGNLADGPGEVTPPLVREGFRAGLRPLGRDGLEARLRWMLCEAFNPYRPHLDRARADALVAAFLGEVLGAGPGGPWSFAAVEPDFLRSSRYPASDPEPHPVYFDGCGNDTATLFHRGGVLCLLLTNGSP